MRKLLFVLVFIGGSITLAFAWGTWGHEHINRAAVFALPDDNLRSFFYNHIDFITNEAGVPDLRKYTLNDKNEFPRHYINLESYWQDVPDSLPRTFKEIRLKYPSEVLQKYGILPWYIQEMMDKLTAAFKQKRKEEILFLAADLGHYLGDAHMPLHTVLNHDGQLTNQKGIHALWESQLPEMFGDNYNFNTGKARYISDITAETWRIILSSYRQSDTLLAIDRNLKASFGGDDKVYELDSAKNIKKNKFNQPIHSNVYAKKYNALLNGMVEKQLRGAISATADFWYTAWVNAGKPNLNDLDPKELTERNASNLQKDLRLWQQGKLSSIISDKEF
ncbi:MAG: S1/P1 Nuclease [Bacteroidetes bacterium]|nr:S1/P1 Nuclease [Bacteroidota bacterium]